MPSEIIPVELGVDDIYQQYNKNIVFYQREPVLVTTVHDNGDVTIKNLITQKKVRTKFNMKDFTPPDTRLGMVNVKDSVVYVCRIPIRLMMVGLTINNIKVESPYDSYPFGRASTVNHVLMLDCVEIGNTLIGNYPTLEQAYNMIKNEEAEVVAFDRQFCLSKKNLKVYYKTEHIGNMTDKDKITWLAGKEYLNLLLDGNYAKAKRLSCLK